MVMAQALMLKAYGRGAARQAGITQTIITATVDSHAQVIFKGDTKECYQSNCHDLSSRTIRMPTILRMESMRLQLLESCKRGMALKR